MKVYFSDYTIADELDIEQSILGPAGFEIVRADCSSEQDVIDTIAGVDPTAMVAQWAPITAAALELCASLQVISRNGIGVDNIDLDYCLAHDIAVLNSPSYCIPEVADHALALALALLRKIVFTTDKVRAGEWGLGGLAPIHRLSELTFGVVGMGTIGRAVVQRARPFFKEIIGHDPYAEGVEVDGEPVELVSFEDLLRRADVVDLHVPGTDETMHMMDARAFEAMKPTAYVINTARGMIIDTDALVEAVRDGQIAGAGLDVHEEEPLPHNHPLRELPQVIITPHTAFYSAEAVEQLRAETCLNIVKFMAGEPPINRVV
jgi:D-3-phosphoglycerate dehydrogenase